MSVCNVAVMPQGDRVFIVSDGLMGDLATGKLLKVDYRKSVWLGTFAVSFRGQPHGCDLALGALRDCRDFDHAMASGSSFADGWRAALALYENLRGRIGVEFVITGFSESAGRICAALMDSREDFVSTPIPDVLVAPGIAFSRYWPQGARASDPPAVRDGLLQVAYAQRDAAVAQLRALPEGAPMDFDFVGGTLRLMEITRDGCIETVIGSWPDRVGERMDTSAGRESWIRMAA